MVNDELSRQLAETRQQLEAATSKNEQIRTIKKQLEERIEVLKTGAVLGDISLLPLDVQADIAERQRDLSGPEGRMVAIEAALRQQKVDGERLAALTPGEQKQVAVLIEKRRIAKSLAIAIVKHQRAVVRALANGEEGHPHPIYAAEFGPKAATAKA